MEKLNYSVIKRSVLELLFAAIVVFLMVLLGGLVVLLDDLLIRVRDAFGISGVLLLFSVPVAGFVFWVAYIAREEHRRQAKVQQVRIDV